MLNESQKVFDIKMKHDTENWYAAQFKPNSCFLAKRNLENQGFKTFLPLMEVTKRRGAKFCKEIKPLFPGYIFVSFDLNTFNWNAVNNTIGLSKLVAVNNVPQSVPGNFIYLLRARCNYRGILSTGTKRELGTTVEVLRGPFSNMIGLVEKIDPKDRITLLFEMLGRKAKVSVSNTNLITA